MRLCLGKEPHGQERNENTHGEHHDGEIQRGIVAGGHDGGIAADQSRQPQKRPRVYVPNGVDEEGTKLLFINSKHNAFLFVCVFLDNSLCFSFQGFLRTFRQKGP